MENPDKYKIFDNSELNSGAGGSSVISFDTGGVIVLQRRFSYKTALGLLAVGVGCMLGVIFVMLFSVSSVQAERLRAEVQALRQASSETCRTEQCLQHAAYITKIMNHSADPCDNFFEYACGNYDRVLPYDHWSAYTNVFNEMDRKAQDDIELALTKPLSSSSADWEHKVKNYYWTCVDYYSTYLHQDNPFVTRVLNRTDSGGLGNYLLGRSLDSADVDLMFRTVSGQYYVPSLFSARSWWNDYLHKTSSDRKYSIKVSRSFNGVGIFRYDIYLAQHEEVYKRFIKEVAQLLVRDSKMAIPNQDQLVETFASDVLSVELQLKQIQVDSFVSEYSGGGLWQVLQPYGHPDRMTKVRDLTSRMSSLIDFKAFLQAIYGPDSITDDTPVLMSNTAYMDKLNTLLSGMKNNDTMEYKRKMGNYLTWVVASFFENDLSPEYRLKFKMIREISWHSYNKEENAHDFCFDTSRWGMEKALSALYIKEYFSDASNEKVKSLLEHLRKSVKDGIDRLDWMDADTKRLAKQRVEDIVEKSGYPDDAKNDEYLNEEFQKISESSDYFGLLLNSIEYLKSLQLRRLRKFNPLDMEHWGPLWNTHFSYHLYDNELLVQAGVLQAPLFSKDLPQQLVYGGMGSLLAHEILRSFDIRGQSYDRSFDGKTKGWWSPSAVSEYNARITCIRDSMKSNLEYYEKDRLGAMSDDDRATKINQLLKTYVNWTAREIGGIKDARQAFDIQKSEGDATHVRLPVYDNSEEQMFYISYAQMNCHHFGYFYENHFWNRNWFPWSILVNVAAAQVPEFAQAFNCKRSSHLNPETRCNIY